MKKFSNKFRIGKMILLGLLAVTALSFALMLLWNWLMPAIFGLTVISFWQALGLLALSKILFGKGQRPHWHHKEKSMMHKEQFMKRFGNRHSRCGHSVKDEDSHEDK